MIPRRWWRSAPAFVVFLVLMTVALITPRESRAQYDQNQGIDFVNPPKGLSNLTPTINVYMKGGYGTTGCYGGMYCTYYDYSIFPSTFEFSINNDHTRGTLSVQAALFDCYYNVGEFGEDTQCIEDYSASGTAYLFSGVDTRGARFGGARVGATRRFGRAVLLDPGVRL